MIKVSQIATMFLFAGALTYADHMSGKLMDASCFDQSTASKTNAKSDFKTHEASEKLGQSCAPGATTTSFVIRNSNGTIYRLDNAANEKTVAALKSGNLKADKDGDMPVSFQGTLQDGALRIESFDPGAQK